MPSTTFAYPSSPGKVSSEGNHTLNDRVGLPSNHMLACMSYAGSWLTEQNLKT